MKIGLDHSLSGRDGYNDGLESVLKRFFARKDVEVKTIQAPRAAQTYEA